MQEKFELELTKGIVGINAFFKAVDNVHIRRALSMLNSSVPLPKSPKICILVEEYMEGSEQDLLKDLPAGAKVSIVADGWTSPNKLAILAIVAYFIDNNWRLRKVVIGFEEIHGRQTGLNIARMIGEVLYRYRLTDRVHTITTDNARNNTHAPKHLRLRNVGTAAVRHIPCLAHVLQISLKEMLSAIKTVPQNENKVEIWTNDMAGLDNQSRPDDISVVLHKVRVSGNRCCNFVVKGTNVITISLHLVEKNGYSCQRQRSTGQVVQQLASRVPSSKGI